MWSGIAFCLAGWVVVSGLGFLGGLGTDPNSMIPLILLFSAGYLALVPEVTSEMIGASETVGDMGRGGDEGTKRGAGRGGWKRWLRPGVAGTPGMAGSVGVLGRLRDAVASARAR